ncbi:MAG: ISNCY family transposase [Chloroflexota bacterium]|nr:ISNCY family transposase [Chloroflexota bacterium]
MADFEPELRELDRLLDDDGILQRVKADLARRHPHSLTCGRHSTPVEVILRLLVVKRLYAWSYEETEHFVGDSLVLRQFCRLYFQPVPDDTTLIRWAKLIGPETLQQIHDHGVALAKQLKVTRGRKLRVDSTVVETNIHYPTDSALVGDGVRVLSRLLHKAKAVLGKTAKVGKAAFRSRTRSVRRIAQELHRVGRRKGEQAAEELKQAYAKLLDIAQASRRQAARVREALQEEGCKQAQRVREQLDHFLPLVEQAMAQARRRVLEGEQVPAAEKLLNLFEPATQIIRRHKAGKETEFGRKLWLGEVEGGIISEFRLLEHGGGLDHPELPASLEAHQLRFGRPPNLLAGDRGVFSEANEELARQLQIKQIVLPKAGRRSKARQAHEQQRWFRRGMRFRAGIEGRIRVLKRDFGLDRCRDHGAAGMGRWVGWGIVTANLAQIAATQAARAAKARERQAV